MTVPANPTVSSIVTQALKRAGRTVPTALQIDEAATNALQEVKADIMLAAPNHPNLLATATTVTTRGQQRYAFPSDYNSPYNITLLDGSDEWRGTAQGGTSGTITLASNFAFTADDIEGKYIIITGGPGIEEYRQILDYDAVSKIATIEVDWQVTPTASSTYLIVGSYIPLYVTDTAQDHDHINNATALGRPTIISEFGQEYLLYPVPDKSTYGIMNRYFTDLSKLDESGDLFIQLLREWRSIWIQGVAVKSMQRFDEDRYAGELQVYQTMLTLLQNQTCSVTPILFKDI